jgi:DNA-binding transcriptional regulator YdaS (Cro superfamily)
MLKSEALAVLGPRPSDLARAIGVTPSAVSQWPEELPPRIADRVVAAIARRVQQQPFVDQMPSATVANAA